MNMRRKGRKEIDEEWKREVGMEEEGAKRVEKN